MKTSLQGARTGQRTGEELQSTVWILEWGCPGLHSLSLSVSLSLMYSSGGRVTMRQVMDRSGLAVSLGCISPETVHISQFFTLIPLGVGGLSFCF